MSPIHLNHKEKMIKKCFNKAAMTYDLHAHPQQLIGEKLLLSVRHHVTTAKNIIDLGCGSGLLTKKLAEVYAYNKFYAIDIADQLLSKAREKLSSFNIDIDEKNFHDFHYKNCLFDLVFSNMALHWSVNLQNTLLNINHNMASNALLTFSLPLKNTFYELNENAKQTFHAKDEISRLLTNAGFIELDYFTDRIVLYFDSLIDALKSIKAVGANYHPSHLPSSLHGKSFLNTLSNKKIGDKTFSLTYEIGFFITRKKHHVT